MTLARAAGDTVHEAHDRVAGALALGYLGRLAEAEAELAEATSLLDETDNATTRAFRDYVAGEIRIDSAPDEAVPLLRRSRDTALRVGSRFLAGIAGASAVSAAARAGEAGDVIAEYAAVIDSLHRSGASIQLWTAIRSLIETLTRLGHDDEAAVLYGALRATRAGSPIVGRDASRISEAAAALRARLGEEAFARREAEGAALGDERAIAYAVRTVDRVGR
jgi:hypothetical protein